MFIHSYNIFILIIIKPIICNFIKHPHFTLTSLTCWILPIIFLFFPLLDREEINSFKFKYFSFFNIPHIWCQHLKCLICCHWESTNINITSSSTILSMSQIWQFRINQLTFILDNTTSGVESKLNWCWTWSISNNWIKCWLCSPNRLELLFSRWLSHCLDVVSGIGISTVLYSQTSLACLPWRLVWCLLRLGTSCVDRTRLCSRLFKVLSLVF